jgi:hypothetical protein
MALDGSVKDYSAQAPPFLLDRPIQLSEKSSKIAERASGKATSCVDKVQVMA